LAIWKQIATADVSKISATHSLLTTYQRQPMKLTYFLPVPSFNAFNADSDPAFFLVADPDPDPDPDPVFFCKLIVT
jgi:hypothetical protein